MRQGTCAVALLLLLEAQALRAQPQFDGQFQPPRLEGAYAFDCGGLTSRVKWREERRQIDRPSSAAEALRVSLLELSVNGRGVGPADFAAASARFGDYAWIDRVEALCFGQDVYVFVRGMPLAAWVTHLTEDDSLRPDFVTLTIRLSEAGVVAIS